MQYCMIFEFIFQNKSLKKLMQIYPHWKEVDLEVLDKIITDRELEELIEAHGIEPK